MKSIFNFPEYKSIRSRIEALPHGAIRQWGQMSTAQMMAHCNASLDQALGKTKFEDRSNFLYRTVLKTIVFRGVKKGNLGKNRRTFPIFLITEEKDFIKEKRVLLKNLDEFYERAGKTEINHHPYFGKLTTEQWGALQYAHFHHHLSQFSS